MTSSTFILRQLKPPVLRLHFSSTDVRETTLYVEDERSYRYKVSTSRPATCSGGKATTVSDSRGLPIIVFRWNTYKRDEIEWVKPRRAGPFPVIKRPISTFFKVGREYATFEDQGVSYVWTREEHDPNAGPDVSLNLSLFSKSRGTSVVCGRVIEGRVLELYQELTDSPTSALEEVCILSAIFALRYLSRDLAANVEQIDYWKFGDGQKR